MSVVAADLLSETFGAMGNVVAEGVWNQLGRPELDRLTLLIRESVQNSWDARTGETIRYALDGFTVSASQRTAYATFFKRQPAAEAYVSTSKVVDTIVSIAEWLRESAPRILIVSDRGTTGLNGPTRADEVSEDAGERNFVDFLRNIGQPPGRARTGGTFGYGKAALYLSSRTRTIVVYTRCRHEGRLQSRLTAAALTHNFRHGRIRYTGRHWWGLLQKENVVEPYVGEMADELAAALGLPQFGANECGTSVAITAPVFDDAELNGIGAICLRHLWPKLKAPDQARPPISLSVTVSGVPVIIPDPSKTAPYDAYWRAYCALRAGQHDDVTYYRETVGRLRMERALMLTAPSRTSDAPDHELRPQHVALLRSPELVVKYMDAGRGLGNEQVGFVGVFRADEEFDDVFARSEPPTHDDWQPSSVADKRARGIVNTALKRVRERCREFAALHSPRVQGAEGTPLARLAAEFGILAAGVSPSSSAEPNRPGPGNGARRMRTQRPDVKIVAAGDATHEEVDGRLYAVFHIRVTHAANSENTLVSADVYPVLSGGAREIEPPNGRQRIQIAWWESPRGARLRDNPLRVGARQQGTWKLFVEMEDNVALGLEVDATSETPP